MNTLLLQLAFRNFCMFVKILILWLLVWYDFDLFYCNIEEFNDFIFLILVEFY